MQKHLWSQAHIQGDIIYIMQIFKLVLKYLWQAYSHLILYVSRCLKQKLTIKTLKNDEHKKNSNFAYDVFYAVFWKLQPLFLNTVRIINQF